MPTEVAARLDDVLAGLKRESGGPHPESSPEVGSAEEPSSLTSPAPSSGSASGSSPGESSPSDGATVTPLRRPSRLPQILLAAAAVVAVGFGVTQILPDSDDTAGDAGSHSGPTLADEQPDSANQAPGAAPSDSESGHSDEQQGPSARRQPGYLTPGQSSPLLARVPLPGLSPRDPAGTEHGIAAGRCGPRSLTEGDRRAAATYKGHDVVVVFHAPKGGEQRASLYLCGPGSDSGGGSSGDPDPLVTVTLDKD